MESDTVNFPTTSTIEENIFWVSNVAYIWSVNFQIGII